MDKLLMAANEHSIEETTTLAEVVLEKLADAEIPGFISEFDPEEAEAAGAFVEDALTEPEAKESMG